ncbi:hypothetical protein [Rubrobacter indicoceani]|uniref:hypothetical protein n=1 Tax=Rubrobacter indicoceani TaxID=2051957 RepID=UPI0013C48324|nr:hypothetical protein [Rubrobacter indicoceani]
MADLLGLADDATSGGQEARVRSHADPGGEMRVSGDATPLPGTEHRSTSKP